MQSLLQMLQQEQQQQQEMEQQQLENMRPEEHYLTIAQNGAFFGCSAWSYSTNLVDDCSYFVADMRDE